MPFIHTRTNLPLPAEKEALLKSRLGEAIATFPGKSEQWLMLEFTPEAHLWFHGENSFPMAYAEVQLLGEATPEACERMTKVLCGIFSEVLDISPDAVYVKYEFVKSWGWNNVNF